jgi:hypothetical protein
VGTMCGRLSDAPHQDTPKLLTGEKSLTAAARARWPNATRFRDLEPGQCRAFLPRQEGGNGWCCSRPVVGGDRLLAESYCAEHRARFIVRPSW